jgi:GNAT superfamily N-acetyltransferase
MNNDSTVVPQTRPARLDDHVAIAALMAQLGYPATPMQILARLQALGASAADGILVAAVGGEVVGVISLHALPLFHMAGALGRITALVVDQRHRSAGIGGALVIAAQHWFTAAGCVKLEVTSGDQRLDAHRFYQRHGFVRDGQRLTRKA